MVELQLSRTPPRTSDHTDPVIIEQFLVTPMSIRDALMDDLAIVQKYEIDFIPTRLFCITHTHDAEITLLPDCERLTRSTQ